MSRPQPPQGRGKRNGGGRLPAPLPQPLPLTSPDVPETLNPAELKLLAHREKKAQDKRAERERHAQAKAVAATAPNPSGYVMPDMPAGLRAQRKWLRAAHDAYSRRLLGVTELAEVRRSVSAQADTYKAGAIVRQSHAAMRQAEAADRLAEFVATVRDGGVAAALLVGLRNGDSGRYRPLAPRPGVAVLGEDGAA